MDILLQPQHSGNPMTDDSTPVTERLKRDVGLHRAAQVLSDASRTRAFLAPVKLVQLTPEEREWFKQTARNMVAAFEAVATDREPDSVRDAREQEIVRQARDREQRLQIERSRVTVAAVDRGHELGPWAPLSPDGKERATCTRCQRSITIDITNTETRVSGVVLTQGCIVAADGREA